MAMASNGTDISRNEFTAASGLIPPKRYSDVLQREELDDDGANTEEVAPAPALELPFAAKPTDKLEPQNATCSSYETLGIHPSYTSSVVSASSAPGIASLHILPGKSILNFVLIIAFHCAGHLFIVTFSSFTSLNAKLTS